MKQSDQAFVQHLGSLKTMWNELNLYRPHTTDSAILLKRADEDKVFQLLASLGSEYENLRSHLLMTHELHSFVSVCYAVQRDETCWKVMEVDIKHNLKARAFSVNHKLGDKQQFKGKRSEWHEWKCTYCNESGHVREKCWILHPKLRPKFEKENKFSRDAKGPSTPKAYHATSTPTDGLVDFTSNPAALINEFAAYIQRKRGSFESEDKATKNPTTLLGQFANFLVDSESVQKGDIPGRRKSEDPTIMVKSASNRECDEQKPRRPKSSTKLHHGTSFKKSKPSKGFEGFEDDVMFYIEEFMPEASEQSTSTSSTSSTVIDPVSAAVADDVDNFLADSIDFAAEGVFGDVNFDGSDDDLVTNYLTALFDDCNDVPDSVQSCQDVDELLE
ncbi:uncharacterized protein [Pyrus communis]|uniref:uncharacterized protein n=1 Tax=Pyrus communis TaxID=23211 RepID=UPI0035BF58BF